jgi:hypothetical protein
MMLHPSRRYRLMISVKSYISSGGNAGAMRWFSIPTPEYHFRCLSSWAQPTIKDYVTWWMTKCTPVPEVQLQASPVNPLTVVAEREDSDSEKWREIASSHMVLIDIVF